MGLEVSRLARNSMDWHRLLEICALTETLIFDEDGVYDPAHFNDRLLLGLNRPDSYSTSYSTSRGSASLLEIFLGQRTACWRASPQPFRPQKSHTDVAHVTDGGGAPSSTNGDRGQ